RCRVGRRTIMSPFQRVVIDEPGPKVVADAFVPIRRIRRGLPRHGSIVACGTDRDRPRRQYSIASLRRSARKQRDADDTSDGPHDCLLCPHSRWRLSFAVVQQNLADAANNTEQGGPAITAGFLGDSGFLDRKKLSVMIPTQLPGPTRAIAKIRPA